tara:strand:- start:48 stop:155 length:108 start_codon:yes stop_codon:yes gene_type:complete
MKQKMGDRKKTRNFFFEKTDAEKTLDRLFSFFFQA